MTRVLCVIPRSPARIQLGLCPSVVRCMRGPAPVTGVRTRSSPCGLPPVPPRVREATVQPGRDPQRSAAALGRGALEPAPRVRCRRAAAPRLPPFACTLCRALFRCAREPLSSRTRPALTGLAVRSFALAAAVPGVAAVGGAPLRSAAQARLTGVFCGWAPRQNPASCSLPGPPWGERAGRHRTSRPAPTPCADCGPAGGGLPPSSVRFPRDDLLGLPPGRSPAVSGPACRA